MAATAAREPSGGTGRKGGWRSGARRALPWLVIAASGFLLGYLVVFLVVSPGGVVPTDRPVPDVRGLLAQDAERTLRDAGFAPRLGERQVNASAVPNTVTAQRPLPPTRKPRGSEVVYDVAIEP